MGLNFNLRRPLKIAVRFSVLRYRIHLHDLEMKYNTHSKHWDKSKSQNPLRMAFWDSIYTMCAKDCGLHSQNFDTKILLACLVG